MVMEDSFGVKESSRSPSDDRELPLAPREEGAR